MSVLEIKRLAQEVVEDSKLTRLLTNEELDEVIAYEEAMLGEVYGLA